MHDSSIQQDEERSAGAPGWTVTFADLMCLLLCMFVLLFSMGRLEVKKFEAMSEVFQQTFRRKGPPTDRVSGGTVGLNSRFGKASGHVARQSDDPDSTRSRQKTPPTQGERLTTLRPGESFDVGTAILFDETSVEISESNRQVLSGLAQDELRGKMNLIEVRGHATARPDANSRYKDAWELAFARCYRTMQYLVDVQGIERRRIRLSVAGSNEPWEAAKHQTSARDSRVEVMLLPALAEEPGLAKGITELR